MAEIIPRYNEETIKEDLSRKMVFMAGPRQVGKTTFAKELIHKSGGSVDKWYLSTGQKIRQDKQDEQDYFIFHHGKS